MIRYKKYLVCDRSFFFTTSKDLNSSMEMSRTQQPIPIAQEEMKTFGLGRSWLGAKGRNGISHSSSLA